MVIYRCVRSNPAQNNALELKIVTTMQGATTQQLLADMYEDADEEGKRSLNAAMAEGERKRQAERAKESGK